MKGRITIDHREFEVSYDPPTEKGGTWTRPPDEMEGTINEIVYMDVDVTDFMFWLLGEKELWKLIL